MSQTEQRYLYRGITIIIKNMNAKLPDWSIKSYMTLNGGNITLEEQLQGNACISIE